jgi:hypothetical protein
MQYITGQANGAQEESGSGGRLPAYIVRHERRTLSDQAALLILGKGPGNLALSRWMFGSLTDIRWGEGPLGKVVGPGPGPVPPPCLGVNVSFSDNVFLEFFRSQVSLSR